MIGAVVQARMGSSRLPGKVLLSAAGKPLLAHLLERLARCRTLDAIVVATSDRPADDAIVALCQRLGVAAFRGSELDVLDRYYQAARTFGLTAVVRMTGDCPLCDPELVDAMVRRYLARPDDVDLLTNRHPLTFMDGLGCDVIPVPALERAWRNATQPHQREHTIPWFWEAGMRVENVEDPDRLVHRFKTTLDYPEDYELIRRVLEALYRPGGHPTSEELVTYLDSHPEVARLNARYLEPSEPSEPSTDAAQPPRRVEPVHGGT